MRGEKERFDLALERAGRLLAYALCVLGALFTVTFAADDQGLGSSTPTVSAVLSLMVLVSLLVRNWIPAVLAVGRWLCGSALFVWMLGAVVLAGFDQSFN